MGETDHCTENLSYRIHQVIAHLPAPSLDLILGSPQNPDMGKSLGNSNASEVFILSARNQTNFSEGSCLCTKLHFPISKEPCNGQEFNHPELEHLEAVSQGAQKLLCSRKERMLHVSKTLLMNANMEDQDLERWIPDYSACLGTHKTHSEWLVGHGMPLPGLYIPGALHKVALALLMSLNCLQTSTGWD